MQLTLFTLAGLVVWLVLWALGQKPIDSFLVALFIMVIGALLHILKRYLPNQNQP